MTTAIEFTKTEEFKKLKGIYKTHLFNFKYALENNLFNKYNLYFIKLEDKEFHFFLDYMNNVYVWNKKNTIFEIYDKKTIENLKVYDYSVLNKMNISNTRSIVKIFGNINWEYSNLNSFNNGLNIERSLFLTKIRYSNSPGLSIYLTKYSTEGVIKCSDQIFNSLNLINSVVQLVKDKDIYEYNLTNLSFYSDIVIVGYYIIPNIILP